MPVKDYTEQSDRRYFKLNAKTGELLENVKEGETYKDVKRKSVEGKFVKLEVKEREREGKKVEQLQLTLNDGEQDYVIKTSWSSLGRSLVNSLAGEVANRQLGNISVSIWNTVNKKGKEVSYLSVYNNAEKTQWKYGIDEQKEMIDIVENKKGEYVSTDYSEYQKVLKACIDDINANDPKMSLDNDVEFGKDETPIVDKMREQDDDNEDLPF